MCLTSQPPWMNCFSATKFSDSSVVNLGKSPPLGDMGLLVTSELEFGPAESLNHMLLVLHLGADGHYYWPTWTLAAVPWGFEKVLWTRLGPGTGDSMPVINVHWKGLSPSSLRATCIATGCIYYQGGCCL